MNTILSSIIIISAMLSNALPYKGNGARLPEEDTIIMQVSFLPLVIKTSGNVAMEEQDNQDNAVIPNNTPDNILDNPITIESMQDCGHYAEIGGHPCPQSDNVPDDIIPPANNNRNH